jgi:hypothetical protein
MRVKHRWLHSLRRSSTWVTTWLACALVLAAVSFGSAPAHAEVGKKLKEGLAASSPKVRIVAAAGVAKTKDPEARTLLEPLLKDGDAAVRAAVVDALGKLGDPGAIPALEAVSKDGDETVQSVLKRVLPELKSSRVMVFIGKGEDYSGGKQPLGEMLRKKTRDALTQRLGAGFALHEDASLKSYGASPIAVRSVVKRTEGTITFVDVKCELTLVEMPGNILRAALSTTASVGVDGKVNEKIEAELARDGVNECASSLGSDFVSYVRERSRR